MLTVSVDLGRIKVAGKTPNLSLTLSSSCTVALPSPWTDSPSAKELSQATSAGEIWISKAGSCQVEILTLINDELPDTESLDPSIMTAIANFAPDCSDSNFGQTMPPTLEQVGVMPTLPISFVIPTSKPLKYAQHTGLTPQNDTYALRSNPRPSKKAAVAAQEDVGDTNPPSTSESPFPDHQHETIESLVAEAIAEMARILDFAFRKLIGVRGISPGMRTIKNLVSTSLIEIAPVVWDLRYLQVRCHAQTVIPSIASGIARLKNARSASLREKLNNLTRQTALGIDDQEFVDSKADATDEVQRQLWLLCQTRIQPEPMKRPFAIKKGDENTAKKVRSQPDYAGQELEIPATYLDEDGSKTPTAMEGYGLELDYEPYAIFPGGLLETGHRETDNLLHVDESYIPGDGGLPLEDWTHSSEGDYFYTDGQGNVYPIERQEDSEGDQISWPSAPQLVDSDGYSQQQDEDLEELWDQDANQTYIISREDGFLDSGVQTRPDDATNQPFLPPYLDDALPGNWAWE
ncbi:hypothetical protein B0I37DRAFT_429233 [Chaetomium sp. MPI-CAGE-AT-0009]|nr:hypothetical protein B0I37DRAFT_429233 [Chaetomium sp. MPI-CAGE-AT-0009]